MIGVDGGGVYGSFLYYSLTIAYVGSAFLIFIYLYRAGQLNMDEGAKIEMMEDNDGDI